MGLHEACGFVPTVEEVEALDGLTGCAFDEVVFGAEDEDASGAWVEAEGEIAEVGAGDVFGVGEGGWGEDANEGAVGVGFLPSGFEGGGCGAGGWERGDGGVDAAVDGDEVGGEGDGDGLAGGEGEFLLDFGEVAVFGDAVGADAFVALDVEVVEFGVSACATDAAHAGDDDGGWVEEAFFEEGDEGEEDAGGVATGAGDERGRSDGVGVDFGETVDRGGAELWGVMGFAVELGVGVDVFDAEIGAEIDDTEACLEEWGGELVRDAVGEGEEGGVCTGLDDCFGGGGDEEEFGAGDSGELGEDGGDGLSGVLAGGDGGEFGVGVAEEKANEFFAGVAAGSDDGDAGVGVHDGWEGRGERGMRGSGIVGWEGVLGFRVGVLVMRNGFSD